MIEHMGNSAALKIHRKSDSSMIFRKINIRFYPRIEAGKSRECLIISAKTILDQLLLVCSVSPVVGPRQYQCCPFPSMPDLHRLSPCTTRYEQKQIYREKQVKREKPELTITFRPHNSFCFDKHA